MLNQRDHKWHQGDDFYFVAFDEAESGTPIYRLEIMSDKITDKIVRVVVKP
jgi:hypothetical protein